MAYNANNEIQTEIVSIEKNDRGEYIKISNIKKTSVSGDKLSYDIRTMYTHKETGDILPTQKGIRVDSEMYPRMVAEMVKGMNYEELEEFFSYLDPEAIADKSTEVHMSGVKDSQVVANYTDAVYVLANENLNNTEYMDSTPYADDED